MMKVLDYEKVNGTQDRDDTILVAQILPRTGEKSQPNEQDVAPVVGENGSNANYFGSKDIVVTQLHHQPGHGPLSPVSTPAKEEV